LSEPNNYHNILFLNDSQQVMLRNVPRFVPRFCFGYPAITPKTAPAPDTKNSAEWPDRFRVRGDLPLPPLSGHESRFHAVGCVLNALSRQAQRPVR
jgi:hypothetical protein